MQAVKYTLSIVVEALSKDCFIHLLEEMATNLENEVIAGNLEMDDGDSVSWKVEQKQVTF